ncbi:hypothetical protein [Rhizobium sp. ICMP 5592]|uniref:hypothetical protein n=1 Tax=Rhizobium sp. ICMP 5592 TaxID=2292445 RepID=UPI0012972C6E|nr:hypothetical protein [Rhizobium sp. ICMP 5592]
MMFAAVMYAWKWQTQHRSLHFRAGIAPGAMFFIDGTREDTLSPSAQRSGKTFLGVLQDWALRPLHPSIKKIDLWH